MDAAEIIRKFSEFFEEEYKVELLEKIRKGEKFLVVDFNVLSIFDPSLAQQLLEQPEDVIKAAELAIEQFDMEGDLKNFQVRFRNLPKSQKILIRNIRSTHLGKLFSITGVVRQKSDVRPQVTVAKFECPSCGNIISVLQLDTKFKEPSRCACGRKGKFKLIGKELVDAQGLKLEEASEDLEGGEQPKRINVFLKNDLVSPLTEKKTNPGTKIEVVGVIKEVPIVLRSGSQSIRFDLLIEANCLEPKEETYVDITISKEEMKQIKGLSEDPNLLRYMVDSIAPSIYGHEEIKLALALQLMGGVRKKRDDGLITRGDIHILLIGDPGSGKSQLLKRITSVSPKSRYVSGKGVTGAGLTATVIKDEFLGGYSLEAGALVLANRGLCCIDELDKMGNEDRSAMHEALEQQTVSIAKANVQATLVAETTVLAAANPKFGRFDPYQILAEQINLPPTLINRFDLIFPVKDLPDEKKDTEMAKFILNLHQTKNVGKVEIETRLLRKYIAYARQKIHPTLTDSAVEEIRNYYLKMRSSGSTEGGIKAIPISPRQLEAVIRLSEAAARLRLSDKVTRKDAKRAAELLHYALHQIGIDPETGKIDIDRIATGVSASERTKIVTVREIINELESTIGRNIPIDDIVAAATDKGIEKDKVEEALERLKRSGDIFEPRRGWISKI